MPIPAMPIPAAETARAFLAGLDDPIADLAREYGAVDFTLPSHGRVPADAVGRLTLSIIGQLISVQAALAVFVRLEALLGGQIDAARLARTEESALRGVGLSYAKARAVRELAIELTTGRFSFDELASLDDEQAEARLVGLRGIGPWSAQMFLLRSLGRPDVFPAGDLGLRRGIELIDACATIPSIGQAATRALAWRPYRSYAAKYLWLHYGVSRPSRRPA